MNIALLGNFLHSGLVEAGHNVIRLSVGSGHTLRDELKKVREPVDFVLVELYGGFTLPALIDECGHKMVAWCIDSPFNEFWLKDACHAFGHVFVDQKTSVDVFEKSGLDAAWLPLCCERQYLMEKHEKKYDLTFIGTINNERKKRQNLLKYLSRFFNINVASGVSLAETQHIFASSRIVLNENMFPGLTLRLLQGLASGSLVATEKNANGLPPFSGEKVVIEYSPDNVLEQLDYFLHSDAEREEMAAHGQQLCEKQHTSLVRARQLIDALSSGRTANKDLTAGQREWHSLSAQYFFTLRFGGRLDTLIKGFQQIGQGEGRHACDALIRLGDLFVHAGRQDAAAMYYEAAFASQQYMPFLRMAILQLNLGNMTKAAMFLKMALKKLPDPESVYDENILAKLKDSTSRILYLAARIYSYSGRIFDYGFQKSFEDRVSDTAYGMASRLWRHDPTPVAMDLMLDALAPYNLCGELLHELLSGLEQGILSKKQILHAADLAYRYYDIELADKFLARLTK